MSFAASDCVVGSFEDSSSNRVDMILVTSPLKGNDSVRGPMTHSRKSMNIFIFFSIRSVMSDRRSGDFIERYNVLVLSPSAEKLTPISQN